MAELNKSFIKVVGADANNLRDVDVSFPIGGISMVVGVSGSGKSSLLKNVLATEGNQRLKDFLGISQNLLGPPMSHAYVGALPATVHVGQGAFRSSSRTTVATSSGLLSLLRKMFVRWSKPVSPITGRTLQPPTVENYGQWLLEHHNGKVTIWAIPLSFVADDGISMAERLLNLGFSSVIIRSETDSPKQWDKGREVLLAQFKPLSKRTRHLVEVSIGTINLTQISGKIETSLADLLQRAFNAGDGRVFVETPGSQISELKGAYGSGLDSRYHWVTSGDPHIYRPADHHLLSFNAPEHEASGACSTCRGLGKEISVDLDFLITNPEKSMHDGACALWTPKNYKFLNIQHATIEGLYGVAGFDPNLPWVELSQAARNIVLYGCGDELIMDLELGSRRKMSKPRKYPGLVTTIMKHVNKGSKTGQHLAFLIRDGHCNDCHGSRWSHAARSLRLGGETIDNLLDINFDKLATLCQSSAPLAHALPKQAAPFIFQLERISRSLVGVGLAYLNGARGMNEISEGESRRIRLAAVFDGRHQGLCLLLDEPARGLHDEDVLRLTDTLIQLRGQHTLIINEHRQRLALAADHFVELGPCGGPQGGGITHAGSVPHEWWDVPKAITRERLIVDHNSPHIHIRGACCNNLRNQDISIPLGHLICVTGLSGSGKSSFVHGVLKPALLDPTNPDPKGWREIEGSQHVRQVINLDQGTPPANRRSIVATFLDLAKSLREHYAAHKDAKKLKLQASDFGLNNGEGRCVQCQGIGEIQDGQQWITCASCGGFRFGNRVLDVRDQGLNIAELLDLTINKIIEDLPQALLPFKTLLSSIANLGLGHLCLGRRLDTLSGGEIQRLRIARQLNINNPQGFVLLLDEPASGLHKNDVANLLKALDHVLAYGKNTVVVVEHNLSIVAASDWVIEFGPGSGPTGGFVVANAPPHELALTNTSTGRMLRTFVDISDQQSLPEMTLTQTPAVNAISAASTLRWLRRLLGDDIAPSESLKEDNDLCPTIVFMPQASQEQRFIEYGGLDRELLNLVLELQITSEDHFMDHYLLDIWLQNPKAQLVVHPLLQDIYIWGNNLPNSLIKERKTLLKSQGYDWQQAESLGGTRIKGNRFTCSEDATLKQRQECLNRALAIGAGYVELLDGERLLKTYTTRFVDIERGIVGPVAMSVYDLQQRGERGKCPCCKGSGHVINFDSTYIFEDSDACIEDKLIFTTNALSIFKGVHRNILIPFFRHMIKEGLFPAQTPYNHLSESQRTLLLHGFWCRPGPGSFLKNSKENPNEVSSWLRWDGLWSHLRENIYRADEHWRQIVLASAQEIPCPTCDGLGLQPYVRLVKIGQKDYGTWIKEGTVSELCHFLQVLSTSTRLEKRRRRLSDIFESLVAQGFGDTHLFQVGSPELFKVLIPLTVNAFSKMPLIMKDTL